MTTTDRPSRRKGSDKRPVSRVRRSTSKSPPKGSENAAATAPPVPEPIAPVERRVYPREPRVWEEWESPLRQRLLARRIVRWVRLRVSRAPDSDRS